MSRLRVTIFFCCVAFLGGCTSLQPALKPTNLPLRDSSPAGPRARDGGDLFLFLSFSGGGTRAAALAYGVLEELRDTVIPSADSETRLLGEVDAISSVSGGSFTAAYYGLYGERIFEDYLEDFLRRDVQRSLILRVLNPVNWFRSVTTGITRTEAAIEYYDQHIFHGATFADLYGRDGPLIEINATDLGTSDRFAFTPRTFRLICTDLSRVRISEAVTASSAFPVAFAPLVLKNHADRCDREKPTWLEEPPANAPYLNRKRTIVRNMGSYLDPERRPYIHLIDGGIADNLGLHAVIDRLVMHDAAGGWQQLVRKPAPKALVIIAVNAETPPARSFEQSPKKPTMGEVVTALSDAHVVQMNLETRALMQENLGQLSAALSGQEVRAYYIEVGFEGLESAEARAYFNAIGTSLSLPDEQVDRLREVGRKLLRESPRFQELLEDLR